MGQAISFSPAVDGHYIDFYTTDNNQTIFLTTQGSYILNQREAMLLTALDSLEMQTRLQGGLNQPILLPLDDGSMAQMNADGRLERRENYDHGIYLRYENGDSWKISDQIYFKDELTYKYFDLYNPQAVTYTDGLVYQQLIWLSSVEQGLVSIEKRLGQSEFRVNEYGKNTGLLSDECTALCRNGYFGVLVGHYGGISSTGDFQLDFSDLTLQAVEQIIMDEEVIYCLTKDALIKVTPDLKAQKISLPLIDSERLIKVAVRKDKSLMVLTDQSFHIIPNQPFVQFDIHNEQPDVPVKYYEIRKTKYYTDGSSVYGCNPETMQWELHAGKKAPQHIVVDQDKVKLLFDNNGIILSKDSAQVVKKIHSEKTDIVDVTYFNGLEYHLTKKGFFRKDKIGYTTMNQDEEAFYKHISDLGEYVFSESAIYHLVNGRLESVYEAESFGFPISQNQFALEGKAVTFTSKELVTVDMSDNSVSKINMAPLTILDQIELSDEIWLLTRKSLIALDKQRALSGEKVVTRVLPLHTRIEKGRLNTNNENLVIAGKEKLRLVNLDGAVSGTIAQMDLVYITDAEGRQVIKEDGVYRTMKKDLPLTLSFASCNYGEARANYSYHLNYDGTNTSEWKNKGEYTFDGQVAGRYTLVAKYVDDVFGTKQSSEAIQIQVSEETVIATTNTVSLWHIPLILISLLLLWFGWWLKGKLST